MYIYIILIYLLLYIYIEDTIIIYKGDIIYKAE